MEEEAERSFIKIQKQEVHTVMNLHQPEMNRSNMILRMDELLCILINHIQMCECWSTNID